MLKLIQILRPTLTFLATDQHSKPIDPGQTQVLPSSRVEDYRKSGLPMLPVTHGSEFTRLQILLYTWVLFAACLLPFMLGMSSWLYLAAAVVLSLWFCVYAWRLMRNYSDELARETFRFSLIHLSALFAALLLDHYLL